MLKIRVELGWSVLALALSACGARSDEFLPSTLESQPPVLAVQPNFSTDDPTPFPQPTASLPPTPRPRPTSGASGSVYLGTVGSDDMHNDLVDPQGLAFAGGSLFVTDRNRPGLLGFHGAIVRFDAATGKRQAVYEARNATESLPIDLKGVAVSTKSVGLDEVAAFVYPISPWGVFGMVGEHVWPLNFGAPYVQGGGDVAIHQDRAWVAEGDSLQPYTLPFWMPDESTSSIALKGVTGLAIDAYGAPWSAAGGKVYQGGTLASFPGEAPKTARDLAFDEANGTLFVLEADRVSVYAADLTLLSTFGQAKIRDGGSLAIGKDGSVYVTDHATKRVYRFSGT